MLGFELTKSDNENHYHKWYIHFDICSKEHYPSTIKHSWDCHWSIEPLFRRHSYRRAGHIAICRLFIHVVYEHEWNNLEPIRRLDES